MEVKLAVRKKRKAKREKGSIQTANSIHLETEEPKYS
jgi:hypothetical protein